MDFRDFLVTPILVIVIYSIAYLIRPYVTDSLTKKYFFPGLTVRIIGAVAVGMTYQFYYKGGDTFIYHTHGSRVIWGAFSDSLESGFRLLFSDGTQTPSIYKYSSEIYFFRDPASFFIVRLSSFFDLFTFSTYSATAIIFGVIGFIGSWMFYLTFYEQYPKLHRPLAWAALFVPSIIFWGSGLLKDTITLACLGIATFQIYKIFIRKDYKVFSIVLLVTSFVVIFIVKKFILQAFLPAAILWIFASRFYEIRSAMLRILLIPSIIFAAIFSGYYSIKKIGEGDNRYDLSKIAKTARVTAYDIRFWSGKDAGSGYTLGELDDSFESLILLAPAAINVALFRPYIWEVKNPLMLIASLESFILFILTVYIILNSRSAIFGAFTNPNIIFALVFSITFAFAVGVSTFNFGTLARYKIPLLPFFFTALILIQDYVRPRASTLSNDGQNREEVI